MNTTLASLYLCQCDIDQKGATSIAKALTHNPTLLNLELHFSGHQRFTGLEEIKDSFHNLKLLLNILIGEEGAQVLGNAFRIKSRCVNYERMFLLIKVMIILMIGMILTMQVMI
jgi:hypothetical protein